MTTISLVHKAVDYEADLTEDDLLNIKRAINNTNKIYILDKNNNEHELSPAIGEIVTIHKGNIRKVLVKPVGKVELTDNPKLIIKR